jgi:uncharacterized membrane protein YcaP (DUF421 family)
MPFASQRSIQREYLLQRLGFAVFVLIVVAASLGLVGDRARIVAHTTAIYALLLLIFRVTGHRTLAETSSFDLVLLLIIGETTQQAMVGNDDTVLGAAVAILSLVSLDMGITYMKRAFPVFARVLEGDPVLLIKDGQLRRAALEANGLNTDDIEEAARLSHGLVEMDDILQATLEKDGQISIVPRRHQPS